MSTLKKAFIVIVPILGIMCIASLIFGLKYYNAYKSVDENYIKNQEIIVTLQGEMDSLIQKSEADELFINGKYDSAMFVYNNLPNGDHKSSLILNREKSKIQLIEYHETLKQRASRAQNLAEMNQNLLGLNIASVKLNFEKTKDSLQTVYNNKIEALENELLTKEPKPVEAPKIGRLTFRNDKGTKVDYFGEVSNGKANGQGIGTHETGNVYDGTWKDNKKHGKGTFKWVEGEVYIGQFVNDIREGEGTYNWPNGDKYVGQWKNDKWHGQGILYDKDGKILYEGKWQKGEFVKANN